MRTKADSVEGYLSRLDRALAPLPRERRREIVEEISDHIAAAQAERPPGDEAALRTMLDRLGEPELIAAEARERFGIPIRERGWLEVAAIVLLLFGGLLLVFGWPLGVVLLWLSPVWTLREKLIATLVVPAGVAGALLVLVSLHVTTGSSGLSAFEMLWSALFVFSVITAIYLARRSKRSAT